MIKTTHSFIMTVLLLGAAGFSPSPLWAASCCGGGGGAALVLPATYQSMVDLSFDLEKYDGFWDQYHSINLILLERIFFRNG